MSRNYKCPKPCPPKCEKPCPKKEKCCVYDKWSCSEEICEKPTKMQRKTVIIEHKICENKKCCREHGYTQKCVGSWECVPCNDPCKYKGKPKVNRKY